MTPPNEIAAEMAERFGISETEARLLLMFGDHRPIEGDEPPMLADPTLEDVEAWHEQAKAMHNALHWTAAGITRNIKNVLSRRGEHAFKPNEGAPLRALLKMIPLWESSGVLQRVADFAAGIRAGGSGEILSQAPSGVVANLLSALDPAVLAHETLARLKEDIDDGPLPVPRRLQDAFDEMDSNDLDEMMQNAPVFRPPTTTRH